MLDVGFPDSSVGTESTCNAGDPGLIPGLGRSPWRKDRLPIPVFWASLVAQKVKNPPAMLETWVRSLGWDNPLEKGKATHSIILACIVHGVAKSQTQLSNFFTFTLKDRTRSWKLEVGRDASDKGNKVKSGNSDRNRCWEITSMHSQGISSLICGI